MQVRLTEKGKKALGFSPDRNIASVSDVRAFVLMTRGMAIKDKGFMMLYDGPVPAEAVVEVKKEPKPRPKRKKEKAVSKKAAKREKAIKT